MNTSMLNRPMKEILKENLKKNVGIKIEDIKEIGIPDSASDAEVDRLIHRNNSKVRTADDITINYIKTKGGQN